MARIKVSVNYNGGSGAYETLYLNSVSGAYSARLYTRESGSSVLTELLPTREGYDFVCWKPGEYSWPLSISNDAGVFDNNDLYVWYLGIRTATNSMVAVWNRSPARTLTFNPNGGTVSPESKSCTFDLPIGDLPVPTLSEKRFLGWFTDPSEGTKIEPDTIYSWDDDITVYAHWESPLTLTFNPLGGQASETSRKIFTGDVIGDLPTATYPGYFFDGWWTNDIVSTKLDPSTVYTWTTNKTVYAKWTADEQYTLTFNANGGTVSPGAKFIRPGKAVGELPEPVYDGRAFLGWFTDRTGGDQWDEDTVFDLHHDVTLYAHWFRYEYTLRFDPNGGTVDETERTVTIDLPVGELPEPTKYANEFLGWFTARDGGDQWDADTVYTKQDDTTIYAHWDTDPDYIRTLSLNAEGGSVSPTTISCTYGLPIDYLPIPEKHGYIFLGWFTAASGGTKYTSGMTCSWSGTLTLHAHWTTDVFGNLTDWFGLETANGPLMLVGSTDGATRSVTETSHSGALAIKTSDSSVGAFERGGILMNPVCTYRIQKSGTVQIKVGKAYGSASITGWGSESFPFRVTKSGYMLAQAEYGTSADGEPILIVKGVANEGHVWTEGRMASKLTDAINQWTVNLTVNPDHVAQDPMDAVSGGGELTECKTLITCDPVVPMENGMPCASDIVHGKIVVTATTNAYFGESAPTAAGSFVETNGAPNSETDVDFTTYAFQAERSL